MIPSHFDQDPLGAESDPSRAVARELLDAGCVAVRSAEPFRLPSGWASPVYIDCRRVISFPMLRRRLVARGLRVLRERGALDGLDAVAGGEASGIALAAWFADALELPMQYVRKRRAGHGQVEGVVAGGGNVLLVDDMMAAGQSKVRFCKALASAGARVRDLFIVFDYGTFPTRDMLTPLGVSVHALATWHDVLAVLRDHGDFSPGALRDVEAFLDDPGAWSQSHGGIGASPAAFDAQ